MQFSMAWLTTGTSSKKIKLKVEKIKTDYFKFVYI